MTPSDDEVEKEEVVGPLGGEGGEGRKGALSSLHCGGEVACVGACQGVSVERGGRSRVQTEMSTGSLINALWDRSDDLPSSPLPSSSLSR